MLEFLFFHPDASRCTPILPSVSNRDESWLNRGLNRDSVTGALDFQETIRRNSTNLSHLMYELCSFKCLKLYSLKFAIAHAQIKIVMLIKIGLNCVA